jgi:SAM-dependent methyltransferase
MYDSLAEDYDRFTNWSNRLGFELPFLEKQIRQVSPSTMPKVLDAACGTGMHAIALARSGFDCAGADLSPKMIKKAQANAQAAGVKVNFKVAGFGTLHQHFAEPPFDALLCLGNSLPHVTTTQELEQTLADFKTCLRPQGVLLLQNRNFDAVLASKDRWMPREAYRDDRHEWLFERFYDFEPDGLIRFNMVTLKRERGSDWQAKVTSSMLSPQTEERMRNALAQAGFSTIVSLGSLSGEAFSSQVSPNLVITARKPG